MIINPKGYSYRLTQIGDKFHTELVYQDGTDRQVYDSEEAAIQGLINGAMGWNHTKITKDDILMGIVIQGANHEINTSTRIEK